MLDIFGEQDLTSTNDFAGQALPQHEGYSRFIKTAIKRRRCSNTEMLFEKDFSFTRKLKCCYTLFVSLVSVHLCFTQVSFDTSKHLSELALKRRSMERLKLQELERQREEQKRREKEEEERRKEEERYDGRQKRNRKLVYDEQGLQKIHVTL